MKSKIKELCNYALMNINPVKFSLQKIKGDNSSVKFCIGFRVQEERAIGKIKKYQILNGIYPSLSPVAYQIFTVYIFQQINIKTINLPNGFFYKPHIFQKILLVLDSDRKIL